MRRGLFWGDVFRGGLLVSSALALVMAAGAVGAEEAADVDGIESIVVTAERTNRTLAETGSSVGVVTGQDLEERGLLSTYDVLDFIPNVVIGRTANSAPSVRGIDGAGPATAANAFFAGTRPRVAFQVDGRTLTFNEAIYLDSGVWDAQQVEVYRGPQSTLQGRNAVGGVIAIKTTDPTFDWNGKARVMIGEDNLQQYSAAVGGPLVDDKLAFRVSADHRNEDSFVTTTPFAAPADRIDYLADTGDMKAETYRSKLLFTPTDAVKSLLSVSYSDAYSPQTLTVKRPFGDYVTSATLTPRFRTRSLVGVSDTEFQVSDLISVSALLTGTDFKVNRYATLASGRAFINGTEYSAEPRITFGKSTDQWSGFLAAYVFDADQTEAIDLFQGASFVDSTLTKAVFGEGNVRITDKFDVTLAARYEEEERDRVGTANSPRIVVNFQETFKVFLPRATAKYAVNETTNVGITVGKGYNAGGAGLAFNPPYPTFQYDKETVWNYEGFVRSSLLDGALQLSGNVFYNDYSNYQLSFSLPPIGTQPAASVIANAEKAYTYGAEVEAKYRILPELDIRGSVGLLETEIERYTNAGINVANVPIGIQPLQGKDFPRSPAFSATVGFTARPLENVDASMDVRYTDEYFSDALNNPRARTKAYTLVNAQLGYTIENQVRLFTSVSNLLDEQTPVIFTPNATNTNNDIANMTRPRRVMGGIQLSF
jgi:outer membrane receptor protein involved in Fe transport